MENITAKIKEIANEKSKANPEPKLKLWDKLYDKHGTEYRVVTMSFHIDINHAPGWCYSLAPAENIEVWDNGRIWYKDDVFIAEDDIGVKYFTTRPSFAHRIKSSF